eukprot:jgi/Tetstr1/463580/TSEL_008459.t1
MEAPEELRGSLQQLSHLSSKFSARPENLLAEALREWAQRRGVLLEAPSEPGQAVEGHQEPAAGSDRRVVGGSSWANLPSMVEEDLFSSRLGGADAHAARVVCHAWKSAVEQNLRRLEASPRGSQGHGCICYLNRFRQVEELKLLVWDEDVEREAVLVDDLMVYVTSLPNFKRLDMRQAEVHCSREQISIVAEHQGFEVEWPVNEMDRDDDDDSSDAEEEEEEEDEAAGLFIEDEEDGGEEEEEEEEEVVVDASSDDGGAIEILDDEDDNEDEDQEGSEGYDYGDGNEDDDEEDNGGDDDDL